jgi:Asparagine synthase
LNYAKGLEVVVRNPFLDNDILDFLTALPSHYRVEKSLYRSTIRRMFPAMFEETAYRGNDIDFVRHIKEPSPIRSYLLHEFSAASPRFQELVDSRGVRGLLTGANDAPSDWLKKCAIRMLARWPETYVRLKQTYNDVRKRTAPLTSALGRDVVVRRLLTLKVTCDVVLDAP